MEKILIVEDEAKLGRFVELELTHEGYAVDKATDGREGLRMAEENEYDLLLLDIMLPGLSGLEILRRVRRNSDVPAIMLTARDQVFDKVTGLDAGADDYITKPFEIEELLARVRVALRRQKRAEQETRRVQAGLLSVDLDRYAAEYDGNPIDLTHREFALLQALIENKGIVMTREKLLEHVWGYQYMGETNVVDVYIRYLRQKIDEKYHARLIQTVRGVGYVLREDK